MTKGIYAVSIASALLLSGSAIAGNYNKGGVSATASSRTASVGVGYTGGHFGSIGIGAGQSSQRASVKGTNYTDGYANATGGYEAGGKVKTSSGGYPGKPPTKDSLSTGPKPGGSNTVSVSGWTSGGGSATAALGNGCNCSSAD